MKQSAVRDAVLAWLSAHEKDMLRLLEEVVNIDSQSSDKEGVDKVGAVFRAHLERAGIATTLFPLKNNGDCLLAKVPGGAGTDRPHVLLLGHMDTVFPSGTAAQRPYRTEGGIAYGPGVADMKAGLVMNTFVAQAFAEIGGNKAPIHVFYTGDEEIASPSSRGLTLEMARGAATVLNAEPGRPSGNVVVARKGDILRAPDRRSSRAARPVQEAQNLRGGARSPSRKNPVSRTIALGAILVDPTCASSGIGLIR